MVQLRLSDDNKYQMSLFGEKTEREIEVLDRLGHRVEYSVHCPQTFFLFPSK